ncbi:ABC transporter permease [Herbiconiux sp. CPCC 205716]|uniref:ABC transporter permease n=1 Tax=Herbiconiux gentiana TaxID=2970912 RepID=A0ABT2GH97_9MICO|nr:ABC transporter permease [Herbiconiux gentiana]MCS5715476.1 ABC transporter permease [Herbiconiux gentiana]
MTDTVEPTVPTAPAAAPRSLAPSRQRLRAALRWGLLGLGLIIVAQYVADAPGIAASSTWGSALRLTVPIAVVAIGGLYSERAGVINVGLEGMMIGGTWMAGVFGWFWGPWAALGGGVVGGLVFGLLMAVLCIEMGLNQLIVGVAINVVAGASARFASDIVFNGVDGGTIARSPRIDGSLPVLSVPFLSGGLGTPDLTGDMEQSGIPVVSQLGGIVGGLTHDVSLAAVIGLLLIPATAYVLWRTKFGLRWRAAGEEPAALQALGGKVHRTRWIAVLVGSGLAGFAGGYLALISQAYVENQTAGRGFIGLATLIFGNWMPSGVFLGSSLFGFSDAVGLGRPETFRALLFILAVVFLVVGALRFWRASRRSGIAPLALGAVLVLVFLFVPLPPELATAAPYLVTLAVLVVAGTTMRPPAALGHLFPRRNSRS